MPILANVIENAFSPLITAFQSIMVFIHNNITGGSWGLAIVGLTVFIRAILVPLTFRQLKSMQRMQELAPQLQALKEKYKEDKQRQQQEMMKLYQEHGINPLASCLPLLLQLPVFISLFYMLRTDLKKHICGDQLVGYYNAHASTLAAKYHSAAHIGTVGKLPGKFVESTACNTVAPHSAKFLFLPDITNKATGVALVVLIVLYVGSQIASTLIATATADPNQRRLFLVLPVIFVIILYRYPAGLLVYWITTNLWTIGQQFVIRRYMPHPPKGGAAPSPNGRTGARVKPKPLIPSGDGDGKPAAEAPPAPAPAPAAAATGTARPPRPPQRKKKKRSGRRR
jgi:YidC/Oxa1 family membrane protein insertase